MKLLIGLAVAIAMASSASAASYDVSEKGIAALQADLTAGRVTSEKLVRAYLARIKAIDRSGPALRSIITLNPDALADARARDKARKANAAGGPLFGIPLLIKDNIETADSMPTTVGSLALASNITHRDAPIVARLRGAGAIILGKTNLSEWANIRSTNSISGWSAVGGLTKNPYALDRSACGSSAGSGAATAASLAAAALGTETDGSLVCPGSLTGIVALKPTVGLVSRTYIVPISHSQDTAGPMARSVADAAAILSVIAGTDDADPATKDADVHKSDYLAALQSSTLKGKRLGVPSLPLPSERSEAEAAFAGAVDDMRAAGAEIVPVDLAPPPSEMREKELTVLLFELKNDLNAYLGGLPPGRHPGSLADVIAFNAQTPRETVLFGQQLFEQAQSTGDPSDAGYIAARDSLRAYSKGALDEALSKNHLDAYVRPTDDPAFRIDVVRRDNDRSTASFYPATSGYPHLTVPMGYVDGLPVGISFIGPAWSEAQLLQLGYAYEKIGPARVPPKFVPVLEDTTALKKAFAPYAK
jgi:amidase